MINGKEEYEIRKIKEKCVKKMKNQKSENKEWRNAECKRQNEK